MTRRSRGIVLLVVQLVLVLSIAGKYLYERKVCPRVWVRTAQIDPNLPMRGRYLALRLAVDACERPRDGSGRGRRPYLYRPGIDPLREQWTAQVAAKNGKLVAVPAGDDVRPELTEEVAQSVNQPCDRAMLMEPVDFFITDVAKGPFPLKANEELWVEVTVPPSGPPRPIQLAISSDAGFKPLVIR
jgi:hypothetical protein